MIPTGEIIHDAVRKVFGPLRKWAKSPRAIAMLDHVLSGQPVATLAPQLNVTRQRLYQIWNAEFPHSMTELWRQVDAIAAPVIEKEREEWVKKEALAAIERKNRRCTRCGRGRQEGIYILREYGPAGNKPVCASCRPSFNGYKYQKESTARLEAKIPDKSRTGTSWSDEEVSGLGKCESVDDLIDFACANKRSLAACRARFYKIRKG